MLETLLYLWNETNVWLELTTLVIPGENDSENELDEMSRWVVETLGSDVPTHFTAFHPDFRMRDRGRTPPETLTRARRIALERADAEELLRAAINTSAIQSLVGDQAASQALPTPNQVVWRSTSSRLS